MQLLSLEPGDIPSSDGWSPEAGSSLGWTSGDTEAAVGWAGAAASPLRAMAKGRSVESFPRTSAQVTLPETGFLRPDKGLLCCPPSSLSGLQATLSSCSHSRIHSAAPLQEAGTSGGSAQPSRATPGPFSGPNLQDTGACPTPWGKASHEAAGHVRAQLCPRCQALL